MDDKANGYGVYLHVNGTKYEGQWKNDLQDGYGVEIRASGSIYEGDYEAGEAWKRLDNLIFKFISMVC